MKRLSLAFVAATLALLIPAGASADPITAFALFGGNLTQLGSGVNVNTGLIGSNNAMSIGNNSNTLTVLGAGVLSGGSGLNNSVATNGDVVFNGNVNLGNNSQIVNIDSGGNVVVGSGATVSGNIRAAGTVQLGNNTDVLGNVDAGATSGVAVTLGSGGSIVGTVTRKAGTTVSVGSGSTVGANVVGTPAAPTSYVATVLPAATTFGPVVGVTVGTGANNVNQGIVAPGSYNGFDFGSGNTVGLTAGTYYFNTWSVGNNGVLNLDLTGGNILLYFTGLVNFGSGLNVNLTGGNASDVYAETKSNWTMGNNGEWFGTIFGSGATSDITYGSGTSLTGALYARNELKIGNNGTVNFLSADQLAAPLQVTAVPEPATLALLGLGLFGLASVRKFRGRKP